MMKFNRKVYLAVVVLATAAIALPVIGGRVGATSKSAVPNASPLLGSAASGPAGPVAALGGGNSALGTQRAAKEGKAQPVEGGRLSDAMMLKAFEIDARQGKIDPTEASQTIANKIAQGLRHRKGGTVAPQDSGEPLNMSAASALSAAVITGMGGRDTQFDEVITLGDFDGREDFNADHSGEVASFNNNEPPGQTEFTFTREAISEHTIANGFPTDIFYYSDSFGHVFVASTTNLTNPSPSPTVFTINLPTTLNAFGKIDSGDQVVVTGLAVSPVVDLTSFFNTNNAFSAFRNQVGEVLYVTYTDTGSGLRLTSNPTQLVRSGVLAFPVSDLVTPAVPSAPIISPSLFPVTVGEAFGVVFSVFDNLAGCCVDDDGSLYFQSVDLLHEQKGGEIVKITSTDRPGVCSSPTGGSSRITPSALPLPDPEKGWQDRSLAVGGIPVIVNIGNNPTKSVFNGGTIPDTSSGPDFQVNTFTNYSGDANLFGNIVGLACGACNTVYAEVARSLEPGDDQFTQNTEGFYSTAGSALKATPTMVIRFSDVVGAFAPCTTSAGRGGVPIGDGVADVAKAGETLSPGDNNFIAFVLGNGPDIRSTPGGLAINCTTANTLKISDGVGFQADATIHSGITVDEAGTVYVVSGGTPAGIGVNPSPQFGEILVFPDQCPADGRADFIDLRAANDFPNPPNDAINDGDGLSTRADHIFWQAPIDIVTGNTPTGIAGLNRGFLLYLNRSRTIHEEGRFDDLPNGTTQGDDSTNPVIFEDFDPGHQVAGGDDQTAPFTGDDDDGAGFPVLKGPLSGGFEFLFADPVGDVFTKGPGCGRGNGVWNGFFLNSDGNITFGTGDPDTLASIPAFRSGPPRIAAAWTELNPGSRGQSSGSPPTGFLNTFPVQALGFAGINDFRIRWINVPEKGFECCGSSNTFSIDLFDDGTGVDENANQPLNPANPRGTNGISAAFDLQEGPTALRFNAVPIPGDGTILAGCPPRADGTGRFCLQFCRMDLLGTPDNPVITGFSVGNQNPLNPPGLCSTDLGAAALASDTDPFRPCCIGEGTEPTIFEFFNTGHGPSIGAGGEITLATPAFDLRFEGNDPGLAAAVTPRQQDHNRGEVCFCGTTCSPPPAPTCLVVAPSLPVTVPPGDAAVGSPTPTSGIINALCNVTLNVVACGVIPNETTIICAGFSDSTGLPLNRPGKTVVNTLTLNCATTGSGVPDLAIPLTNVTPVNQNLIQGTLAVLPGLPGTAFPLACCGGPATLVNKVTFSAGDNNIFGPFTLSMTCMIDLGLRAPVVISASPSGPFDCSNCQDLLITGACFILPNGTTNVTSVFAVDIANSAKVIQATRFTVLSPALIDALFCFGSSNAGHTFLIFASGPNGTSRNLSAPVGTCPIGNEQGIQVTVKCTAPPPSPGQGATITNCDVSRNAAGAFILTITGTNIADQSTVLVGGQSPKKVKFVNPVGGVTTTVVAKGKFCGNLPGPIVVTSPSGVSSAPFQCNKTCATQ